MPTRTLSAGRNLLVPFNVPTSQEVEYTVEAERPVNTYVFDEVGQQAFYQEGDDDWAYGGFKRQRRHHQRVVLPFQGKAYLVILNPSKSQSTAVHYSILR